MSGRRAWLSKLAFNLMRGHWAVARIVVRMSLLDLLLHWQADPDRGRALLLLDRVGAVVPRAARDYIERRTGHEVQNVARLQAHVLHAQVTGHVVAHLAERSLEIGAQQPGAMPQHEVLERIENARSHFL